MENNNINTNVAQIIFPKDMEIRKIKKKKKKSSSEKKKVLNELKETLKEYDTSLSVAASKKINIPAEIGILPNNITQINSIKELKELTATLKARIQIINQLVATGNSKERETGLFNEGTGGQRLPITSGVFPQQQPQILPNQPILPNQIQPIPSAGNPTQIPDSDAEESLDKLREELLNKLSPEDKAKAEAQLEEERIQAQKDFDEEREGDIRIPADDSQEAPELETDLGFDIGGGKRIDLKSPKGWTIIYGNYRKYVEKLTAKLIKIDDGVFEITPLELSQLNESRNDILNQHDALLKTLNQSELQYIDSDPNLKQLDTNMITNLTLDPISLIKEIGKAQKVEIKEITSGETSSETKLKEKRTEKVKKLLTKIEVEINSYDLIIKSANEAKQTNNKDELKQLAKEVQDDNNAITVLRDALTGIEQVSMEAEYQSFKSQAAELERNLVRMQNENILLDTDGNVELLAGPISIDADIPKPKPDAISPEDQQRVNILIAYYKNVNKKWVTQERNAYRQLFNEIELAKIQNKKGRAKKLPVIKKMIQEKFPSIPDSDFISTSSF